MKEKLLGKTFAEIQTIVKENSLPTYTAKQITEWIYKKNCKEIAEMSNISLKNRNLLAEKYEVGIEDAVKRQISVDGTIKYLFKIKNEHFIEAVYIPDKDRATLCVSSQIGCKMNCLFCMTGKQGFSGNLSTNEILNQLQAIPEKEKITNIVFMGMGEPLDNTEEVMKALEILTSTETYAMSPKRITLSTIGVLSQLKVFLDKSLCHLAISIHTPFAQERLSLMPIEKKYPIHEVIKLIKQYDFSRQRRVSFEYIIFNGLNDSIAHATELARLLKGINCRVNLIKYHQIPEVKLKSSKLENMLSFQEELKKRGVFTTIRKSRGEDIFAACGLLSTIEKG